MLGLLGRGTFVPLGLAFLILVFEGPLSLVLRSILQLRELPFDVGSQPIIVDYIGRKIWPPVPLHPQKSAVRCARPKTHIDVKIARRTTGNAVKG